VPLAPSGGEALSLEAASRCCPRAKHGSAAPKQRETARSAQRRDPSLRRTRLLVNPARQAGRMAPRWRPGFGDDGAACSPPVNDRQRALGTLRGLRSAGGSGARARSAGSEEEDVARVSIFSWSNLVQLRRRHKRRNWGGSVTVCSLQAGASGSLVGRYSGVFRVARRRDASTTPAVEAALASNSGSCRAGAGGRKRCLPGPSSRPEEVPSLAVGRQNQERTSRTRATNQLPLATARGWGWDYHQPYDALSSRDGMRGRSCNVERAWYLSQSDGDLGRAAAFLSSTPLDLGDLDLSRLPACLSSRWQPPAYA
jgi:hypothetical protein